jgi:hypothetical protein
MEFTTMFSQNGKELTVLSNFKFKFKYESKINGNKTRECTKKKKKKMQGKIGFHKEKILLQEKSVLDHNHESDFTIERRAVRKNIEYKLVITSNNKKYIYSIYRRYI